MTSEDNIYADIREPHLDYSHPENMDMMRFPTTIGFTKSGDFENQYNLDLQEIKPYLNPPAIHLIFHSKNVAKDLDKALRNGAKLIAEIHKTSWTEELAYVSDLNGVVIAISGNPRDVSKDHM